ncbi:MAG: hypothetical protein ACLUT5_13830 [Butyricicoccus sp.]
MCPSGRHLLGKPQSENYAGKTIDLYLVAVAADDSGYADSPNGIVYTMTVPMRLNTPSVKWSYNWNATANNPIPAAASKRRPAGHRYAGECGQRTAGGSTYLLRAKITGTDGTTVTSPFRNERKRRQLRLQPDRSRYEIRRLFCTV